MASKYFLKRLRKLQSTVIDGMAYVSPLISKRRGAFISKPFLDDISPPPPLCIVLQEPIKAKLI